MTALELTRDVDLVVFDADNTLRLNTVEGRVCPYGPDEWALLPNVRETLATLDWGRLRVGAASNQDHVGYGHLSLRRSLALVHDALDAALGPARPPRVVRVCPHVIEAHCACRKPQPGMLLAVVRRSRVVGARTLFVGDADSDREAAARAGVGFAWAWDFFGWGPRPAPGGG